MNIDWSRQGTRRDLRDPGSQTFPNIVKIYINLKQYTFVSVIHNNISVKYVINGCLEL